MSRGTLAGFVSVLFLAGCPGPNTNQPTTQAQQQIHRRPRRRNVQQALAQAVQRASECLPRAAGTVTVNGSFRGPTGEYRVDRIESSAPLGTSVRTCVREEFESSRVEVFADERYNTMRSFGPDGVIVAAQNGSSPATTGGERPLGALAASGTPAGLSLSSGSAQPDASGGSTASSSPAPEAVATNANAASPAPSGTTSSAETGATASNTSAGSHARATTGPARPFDAGPLPTAALSGCYQSVVRVNPAIAGRIRLRFEITPDGAARNVIAAAIGAPTGPVPLFNSAMRCIEQRTRAYAFPRSASGAADLVVTFGPTMHGPAISIAQRNGGLTTTAPGMDTASAEEPSAGTTSAGTATATTPAGAGSFDDQIANTVRSRVGDIRTCYQGQLAHAPDLQLRMRVRFAIEPAGHVPTASSTTVLLGGDADAATAVAQCVEGIVRGTTFPVRNGGSTIETQLPFAFSPGPTSGATASAATPPATAANAGEGGARPAPTGHIDARRTAAVIQANTEQVRGCYTSALRRHPDLAGRVLVHFTVDPSGRVLAPSSQVTPTTGERDALESVASCIESVLGSLTLPEPSGGPAAVALPFDFSPTAL